MMKIKNKLVILFLFVSTLTVFTQNKQRLAKEKKIQALRIAFITDKMNFTETEAEKFWPIFNAFNSKMNANRKEHRKSIAVIQKKIKSNEEITEEEAKTQVLASLDFERNQLRLKSDFIKKLESFLSYKRIVEFHLAEKAFNKSLFERLKRKKTK